MIRTNKGIIRQKHSRRSSYYDKRSILSWNNKLSSLKKILMITKIRIVFGWTKNQSDDNALMLEMSCFNEI